MKGEPGRPSKDKTPDNVRELERGHGNSRAYSIDRVKREAPELYEAVIKDDSEALTLYREAINGELRPRAGRPCKDEGNVCAAKITGSTNNAYWQARIQRDCPDELEAIKDGEKTIHDVRPKRDGCPRQSG